ncbi:MAG: hypothetical protein V1924_01215 [Candidatus Bathyarchaeota archaeon]
MSAEKVHELHRKLSEKLVEEAMLAKEKANPGKAVKLSQEIVAIRREINSELDNLKGVKKQKAQQEQDETE